MFIQAQLFIATFIPLVFADEGDVCHKYVNGRWITGVCRWWCFQWEWGEEDRNQCGSNSYGQTVSDVLMIINVHIAPLLYSKSFT